MLRYLSLSTLCDVVFTWFLFCWFVTRHVLFNIVIWSAYADAQNLMPFAWDPEHGHFFTLGTWYVFVSMIVSLQVRISWYCSSRILTFHGLGYPNHLVLDNLSSGVEGNQWSRCARRSQRGKVIYHNFYPGQSYVIHNQ
jgi:hypothetical protein